MVVEQGAPTAGCRSLWPLPGGSGSYLKSLAVFLDIASETDDAETAIGQVLARFPQVTSRKAARSYLRVVADLGLVELRSYRVGTTQDGQRFRAKADPRIVRRALEHRIAGVPEIVAILRRTPLRIGLLLGELRTMGFDSWATAAQVRHRLRWLEEVGVVGSRGRARPEYFVLGDRPGHR